MATSLSTQNTEQEEPQHLEDLDNFIQTLPRIRGWEDDYLHQYQGFWFHEQILKGALILHNEFKPAPSHVILASFPKSGTTWLKALLLTIVNRNRYDYSAHPLLTVNPHDCVPWMERCASQVHLKHVLHEKPILATHLPYSCLTEQIKSSEFPIIYICRNPKDVVVSFWSFINKARVRQGNPSIALEEVFDKFCDGTMSFQPYWDHILGYWKASIEFPHKVLFLMYENLKRDPFVLVKRLAEFIRHPFSSKEEIEGVIQKIINFCSFDKLSSLTVNQEEYNGPQKERFNSVTNDMFFRKGEVGDYKNYLTEKMVRRIEEITKHKLQGSGFKMPI